MRLRKSVLAVTAVALAGALTACGDPITGGVDWFVRPAVSQHIVNANGQDVLHVVLNQTPLGDNFPGQAAGITYPGSSFREDCAFNVPPGTRLPVSLSSSSLSGVCTLVFATGSSGSGHNNKVYIASGKATGLYAKLPSLSGSGTLQVRQAFINGQSVDTATRIYLRVTARP